MRLSNISLLLFDTSILIAAARLDRLADAEVVTVNFNVLHDPTSISTSKAHSYAPPSSSSSSHALAAVANSSSSSSSSSTSSTSVGKIPPPILTTTSYLNKMKQRVPTEGKGWWVNNEEEQGEGTGKEEKERMDGGNSNNEAKQGIKGSEDFSYGVKSASKENEDENEEDEGGGGESRAVKESQPRRLSPGNIQSTYSSAEYVSPPLK